MNADSKIRALVRNCREHHKAAHRNIQAKAYNVSKENSHMSIELTLKAVLMDLNNLLASTLESSLKTHNLYDIMMLDNRRLTHLILGTRKGGESDRKLHEIIAQIISSAHSSWWLPEQRYYGSCDRKTAENIYDHSLVILNWSEEYLGGF